MPEPAMPEKPTPRHPVSLPMVGYRQVVPMVVALVATVLLLCLWRPAVLHGQSAGPQSAGPQSAGPQSAGPHQVGTSSLDGPIQPPDRRVRVGLATPQQLRDARLADEPTTVFFRRRLGSTDSVDGSGVRPFMAEPSTATPFTTANSGRSPSGTPSAPAVAPAAAPATSTTAARWLIERQLAPYPMTDAEVRRAGRILGGRAGLNAAPGSRWLLGDVVTMALPKGTVVAVGDRILIAQPDEEIARGLRMVLGTGLVEITSLPKPGVATGVIRVQTGDISTAHLVLPTPSVSADRRPASPSPATREARVDWVSSTVASASLRTTVLLAGDAYDGVQPGDLFLLSAHDGTKTIRVALVRVVRSGWMGSVAVVVQQYASTLRAGLTAKQVPATP